MQGKLKTDKKVQLKMDILVYVLPQWAQGGHPDTMKKMDF